MISNVVIKYFFLKVFYFLWYKGTDRVIKKESTVIVLSFFNLLNSWN